MDVLSRAIILIVFNLLLYPKHTQASKHTEKVIKRSVQCNFDRTTMHKHTVTYMLI